MPKKTRKEKQQASLHKKQRLLERYTAPTKHETRNTKRDKEIHENTVIYPVSKVQPQTPFSSPQYFIKDLRKSLILIIGIIALEIVVYFASINNYLKF